tara:strand:+ start:11203 stop:17151 length:5949 start_codon:yes stop_codon:yes gene_type:complete
MADTDIVDINEDIPTNIDFTKPVELREREETFEFDTPKIREDIIAGSDINEDDKRRLIMLHIASKTNQDPNEMDYNAAVGSYIGKFAQDAPISQTFERIQGKISPEIDDNYKSLQEFTGMSEEEQLKKSVQITRTPSDSGMVVGSMFGYYDPSRAKTQTVEEEQAATIAKMTPEQKQASIAKYQKDLFDKSPRAIIENGEKNISDKARLMADKMSFGHNPGLAAYNDLSQTDKSYMLQYVRAINPAVDSSSWDYLTTRIEQTGDDIVESLAKTGQRISSSPDDPTRVYEKFATNMDKSAVDYFADNGKWETQEDEQQARRLATGIMESTPAYRMYKQMERNLGATGRGLSFSERFDQREAMIQSTMDKLQTKLSKGREHVNQRKFDKAVKGATRKLFKAGIAEKVIVEGTVVMADMGVALAVGIPTAGAGTVGYSYGRVFGDFVETLIDDHNVDPDEAKVIGGVGAAVYAGIEKAQTLAAFGPFKKNASAIQKKFMGSLSKKLPEFVKKISKTENKVMIGLLETARTMTVETAEESAQAFSEQLMKAYAKEYADAEGIEYSDLVGDWWNQTKEAVTGMALISMGRGTIRGVKGQSFSGGFDNLTGKENINANPGGLELDIAAKSFDQLSPAIQEDLQEAVSVGDITEILEENNINMTAQDYLRVQDIGAAVDVDVEVQREELEQGLKTKSEAIDVDYIDVNRDIERASQKADVKQFIAPMSEHVDLTETAPGKFNIKSKTNDNYIDVEFAPMKSGEAGKYQNGTVILPENAKDFTFSHEMFHRMFDLGVITEAEQKTLVESAVRRIDTDSIDARYKEKYASLGSPEGFTEAIRDEEFMAHLVETAAKDPNFTKDFTPEERTIWQKVIEFIQSLYSAKIRGERKARKGEEAKAIESSKEEAEANAILNSILTGEVLTRDVADPSVDTTRFSISQDPDSNLAAIALAGYQFEKGKALNEAQINKALDAYGVTDETARIETVQRADMILNEMTESTTDLKDHKGITQALIAANLNVEYKEGLDRIEQESFKGGKTYQKAIDRLKKSEKAARLSDTQDLDESTLAFLTEKFHENIIREESDLDVARLLPSIEQAIKDKMVKSKLITKRNKKGYKSMPEYRATLAKTLESISMNLVRQITPGRRKTALYADARKLKNLTTARSIENNFNKLIARIHESRITDDKATLLKRFNKIFKSAAVRAKSKSNQELIHSKVKKDEDGNITAMSVHPMVKNELNLIKQVAEVSQVESDKIRDDMFKFYNDPSDLEGTDADALFKDLEERFEAFKKYKHLEPVDRAAIMAKTAAQYGGIKEKTATELSDSIDSITDMIEDSKKVIENVINEKNAIAQPRRDAVANLKGKRRGELGQKFDRFLASSFGMRSFFQDILRQAPSDKGKAAKKHLDEMLENWNKSIHARDAAKMEDHDKFGLAIQDIYNSTDAWAVEKDLNTKKAEYEHLSKHGDKISKFQVMQLFASAVQQDYLENAKNHNRQSAEYAKVLTPQDMKMIQWFRDYYSKERNELSEQMEKMTGIPIEMLDPFYVPVKVESNQAGLGTEINATAIIPPGMIKRVNHNLDFDESVGMFEIWARKVEENNHFKYTADAAVEMRSVFSTKPVHEALEYNYGRAYKNAFLTMIKDNINDGGPSTYDLKAIDKIRGAWTASKFTLNARIGIKQVTSIPAFGLEIGLVDTAKHVKSFWSPEGWEAVREIWNSDLRKERWGAGNTEAINNAIGGMGAHTTLSKWVKRSMIFNNLGDMAPTLMVGQGIYRSYTETYYSQGASMEEAKQRALSKTFQIVESTQQSSKLKDMAEWQRRGGSLGKMAAQFTNTTRQFLERDFTDIRAYLADRGDLDKRNRAASTIFINHVLLPGAYNGMNMIINKLMGDDIDEDDWWLMFSSMISGPMSGFIVFGSMITGAIETGVTGRTPWGNKSLTPFAGIKDDVNNVVLATEGILTADWDQFDKSFTKLMKSLFAPYREVSKIGKNYK